MCKDISEGNHDAVTTWVWEALVSGFAEAAICFAISPAVLGKEQVARSHIMGSISRANIQTRGRHSVGRLLTGFRHGLDRLWIDSQSVFGQDLDSS